MVSIVLSEIKTNDCWKKELNFYDVDLSNVDFTTDWRFRIVEGKRKLSTLLGTIEKLSFPVSYPILLDNNEIINKP